MHHLDQGLWLYQRGRGLKCDDEETRKNAACIALLDGQQIVQGFSLNNLNLKNVFFDPEIETEIFRGLSQRLFLGEKNHVPIVRNCNSLALKL